MGVIWENLILNSGLGKRQIQSLGETIRSVKQRHPFKTHAWVVLPEHMHCVIQLPENDTDYPGRWRLIKMGLSKSLPRNERLSATRQRRGERGIWQRRYWEHFIKDEADCRAHMDYVHINPVKHGLVSRVSDWPFSTFYGLVDRGVYPVDWAGGCEGVLSYGG